MSTFLEKEGSRERESNDRERRQEEGQLCLGNAGPDDIADITGEWGSRKKIRIGVLCSLMGGSCHVRQIVSIFSRYSK